MATFSDIPFGLLKETTYGTPVTVSRWFEHTGETFDYNKNIVEPKALRVGSRMGMTTRRVITTSDAGGDVTIPCLSKGMGTMWEQCMGSGTSTLVSGSTYQQLFTFADVMPSATYQIGIPRYDGTTTPFTYSGGMVDSFELEFANGEVAMLKVTVDARDVTTATALASPTMPAAWANLFHFANGSLSTGTLTPPTTWSVEEPTATALASSVTPLTNVRSGNIKVSHNLNTGGYNFGASGKKRKPSTGLREVTGSLTVEFDSATFTDAVLSETPMTLVLTFTGGALSDGTETLQVVLSEIKLDGKMPTSNGGDEITVDMSFTAGENGVAAQGMWIVTRTADVAL